MNTTISKELRDHACYRMDESLRMIRRSLDNLHEDQLWKAPNAQLPSMGNLILHLCGNIGQYVLASLDNQPDTRQRDAEFAATGGHDKEELWGLIEGTVGCAKQVINQVDDAELIRTRAVQGFEFSGVGIIMHVVEHLSYHTGQIAFWTKYSNEIDLGFYADFDLNTKNKD